VLAVACNGLNLLSFVEIDQVGSQAEVQENRQYVGDSLLAF
jgi:hypothetical protein